MEDLRETKNIIQKISFENYAIKQIIKEKNDIIKNLMSEIEDLENDLSDAKANGFIKSKRLVLPKEYLL